MEINDELRELILVAPRPGIEEEGDRTGMITLRRSGLMKVALDRPLWKKSCAKRFYRIEGERWRNYAK